MPSKSFIETPDNVIVEALRREGSHIEVRLVECLGSAGTAKITVKLPHKNAVLTNLIGRKLSSLPTSSPYTFPVRPQQIVTLHFEVTSTLSEAEPFKSWDSFVPENKLPALHTYDPILIGHPRSVSSRRAELVSRRCPHSPVRVDPMAERKIASFR